MRRTDLIHIIAGTFTLGSALLAYFVNKNWLFFTMFVGLNLFQFGFTKWCLMDKLLEKLGMKN